MKVKAALTKKMGPLPRWAWAAIILVGLVLYMRYRANQQQSQSAAQNATDPYSSYNSQGLIADSGYPYDASSVGGTYPVSGGMGSGFDPTSFQEGLQYGQGFGTTNTTSTDSSVPTSGAGDALPSPTGGDINVIIPGAGSTGTGGSKGHNRKKQPTRRHRGSNPSTNRHTSTGGGQPNRHQGTHTKKPTAGRHKTTTHSHLNGGGSSKPAAQVVRGSQNHPAPSRATVSAPKPPKPPERRKKR